MDLRRNSPTLLQWHAEELSVANRRALLIPPGFAHGFQALEPDSELVYVHSAPYSPSHEGGLNPRDPRLAIQWLLDIAAISEKDANIPMIGPDFQGITL